MEKTYYFQAISPEKKEPIKEFVIDLSGILSDDSTNKVHFAKIAAQIAKVSSSMSGKSIRYFPEDQEVNARIEKFVEHHATVIKS